MASTSSSVLAPLAGEVDQLGHELRLGADRELGMGVEHQPQQRRPRAPDPDDERRRRGAGGTHAGAAALAAASDSNSFRPSAEPVSGSTACSGWGINPTTLPRSLLTPATSATEPFGFCPGA